MLYLAVCWISDLLWQMAQEFLMLCITFLILCTYLFTPWCRVLTWEANWFAASQVIPRISWNPKVYLRTHKRPPPVCILDQPNPVHIPTSHLLEIHPNIIHPTTPRSPQWSLSLRFPHQDPIHPPLLTYTRHMPNPQLAFLINWQLCMNIQLYNVTPRVLLV